MPSGLPLSISGVYLCSWDFRGLLSLSGGYLLCTNLFMCMWTWGDWAHYACSSLQSDLLVLIGKDSSNKHRGVVVTQAWHECREAGSAGCSPLLQPSLFPQTQPSLCPLLSRHTPPNTHPAAPGCPRPLAWPHRVATEWALCLDTAISSQRTSEKWAGQGSGQRRRQKHGCLRHLGSQQLTEGPTQRRSCWRMGSVICIKHRPPSLRLCTRKQLHEPRNTCDAHKHARYATSTQDCTQMWICYISVSISWCRRCTETSIWLERYFTLPLNPLLNDESTGGAQTLRPLPGKCSILVCRVVFAKRC